MSECESLKDKAKKYLKEKFEFIYRISWYESKRHTKSHTSMYYLKQQDTLWAFDTLDWVKGLLKVEIVRVSKISANYRMAVLNSRKQEESLKNNSLTDESLTNESLTNESLTDES